MLGVSWTVQAAALPAPERGDLIAARAASWLSRYRLVESAFAIDGAPAIHAGCLQGWFPASLGQSDPGTVLHFGRRHATIAALAGHKLSVTGVRHRERPRTALALLELAGCARVLGHDIAALLQTQAKVHIERATVTDQPAIGIRVPVKHGRMVVYVTPRTYRPIAVSLTDANVTGRSRIRLTRLTPTLLHPFELRP